MMKAMISQKEVFEAVKDFLSSPFSYESLKIVSNPHVDRIWFDYKNFKVYLDKSYFSDRPGWVPLTHIMRIIPLSGKMKIILGDRDNLQSTTFLERPSFLELASPTVWYGVCPQGKTNLSISVVGDKFEKAELVPPPLSKGRLSIEEENNLMNEFHEIIFQDAGSFTIL